MGRDATHWIRLPRASSNLALNMSRNGASTPSLGNLFQCLKGDYRKAGEGLFFRGCSDRTRGNGFNLKEGRFRLDVSKKVFTLRVVRHWHRLPREAANAPSLEVFKARLDGALGNLVWWEVSLPMAGDWNWMGFNVPSSPNHSVIL